MGIYVNGIEMPKEPDEMIELAIFGDGKTLKTGESWRSPVDGKCYYGPSEDMNTYSAFTVPPHGRLIDANAFKKHIKISFDEAAPELEGVYKWLAEQLTYDLLNDIEDAPTIIEAEEGE